MTGLNRRQSPCKGGATTAELIGHIWRGLTFGDGPLGLSLIAPPRSTIVSYSLNVVMIVEQLTIVTQLATFCASNLAPRPGLEPGTIRLTVERSTN